MESLVHMLENVLYRAPCDLRGDEVQLVFSLTALLLTQDLYAWLAPCVRIYTYVLAKDGTYDKKIVDLLF